MTPSPLRRALLALGLLTLATGAHAQQQASWPSKPVKIMVGFPAGTSPDLVARTLAEPLSKAIGTAPLVLAAPVDAPGKTTAEFLAAARSSGDKWSYGSPGVGTVGHIGMELLKARVDMNPVHVPYPGYPQVVTAMLGGQIQLSMLPPGLALAQARAGKVRVLGVTSAGRSTLTPEIPSLAEAGVKNFQLEIWNAVAGPASMPKPVVARLSALFSEIARSPEVRQRLFQQGWQVAGGSSEALALRIKSDTAVLGKIIADRAIKA
ncbi:MAG: tripartite tricarboxylate transporter substrate binding protein, partial [Hylemonella sp.]